MNAPRFHPNALSAAVAHIAKSAIRGIPSSRTLPTVESAPETASKRAARMRGLTSSNSCHSSASGRRSASEIGGKVTGRARSRRSGRVATSAMPLRISGRVASKRASSESVYSSRAENPPPVERRHIASESQGWRVEMLSKATHQELVAAITRSRSFRGVVLSGAVEGSTSDLMRRSAVLLAEPCSPWKRSTG